MKIEGINRIHVEMAACAVKNELGLQDKAEGLRKLCNSLQYDYVIKAIIEQIKYLEENTKEET